MAKNKTGIDVFVYLYKEQRQLNLFTILLFTIYYFKTHKQITMQFLTIQPFNHLTIKQLNH